MTIYQKLEIIFKFYKKLIKRHMLVYQFTRNQPFFQIESRFPADPNMGLRPLNFIFRWLRKILISYFEKISPDNLSKLYNPENDYIGDTQKLFFGPIAC